MEQHPESARSGGLPPESGESSQTAGRLLPVVYDRLRNVAHGMMAREGGGHTIQGTALVHEAYLRLTKPGRKPEWRGPSHFSGVVVGAMRRILVERARRKKRLKRGGGMTRLDLDPAGIADDRDGDEALLALDEALTALAAVNPGWAELVQLRYFLGMTVPEAARELGVSPRTADAWWAAAGRWLREKLALDLDTVVE